MSPRQRCSWHPGGKTRPLPIFRAPEVCWTQLSLSWYSLFPLFTHFSPWGSHVSFSSAVAEWLDLPLNLIKHKSHIYVPPMGSGKFWRCTPRSASSLDRVGCFLPATGPHRHSLLHVFFWKLPNTVGIVAQGQDRDFPDDEFAQILEIGDLGWKRASFFLHFLIWSGLILF